MIHNKTVSHTITETLLNRKPHFKLGNELQCQTERQYNTNY